MSDSPTPHPAAARLRACDAFHHIPFTPVPVQPRHDGWTPARQRGFIDRLCLTGCVSRSARAVGKTPQSVYRLREHARASSFADAWDHALEAGTSYQIDCGLERAIVGQSFPIMRRGQVIGERIRHDNRLAMTVLGAMDRREQRRKKVSTENKR